jgi:DNA topoisomerase-1
VTGENLVIVESPAKAKALNKYLGSAYTVLASYGHVRDLPAKDGSVRPDEDFAMDWTLVGERAKKHVDEIAQAAKSAKRIYLATDPDREGEAISWHVQEVLSGRRGLGAVEFKRITFNEITKSAVLKAFEQPRDLNEELIQAYLARRALDYLVGFTLSPVLWRKLPGSRSAGRVQSVALRLICDREAEIEDFRAQEFWTVEIVFRTEEGAEFTARLTHLDGAKLDKFALGNEEMATRVVERLAQLAYRVDSVERKEVRRNPAPPFTTSTLQQEASRKLGFSASQTMRTAQRLYEGVEIGGETVGLITYMRTDGLQLAGEAVAATRGLIGESYGDRYVPDAPRVYKSTAKNAQEAHEAIRPTDVRRRPAEIQQYVDRNEARLYELIWKRTLACQMASAVLDQMTVDVAATDGSAVLRATGSVVKFDGFLRVYEEGQDDAAAEAGAQAAEQRRLPPLKKDEPVDRQRIEPQQHFTQPPPRYTEASLVKKLEELGIGRPSTYATILQVLQDRNYVRLEKKRFLPEDRGRLVTAFLTNFFQRYVEYDFTAKLEEQLDDISGGRIDWKQVLRDFWAAFASAVDGTKGLSISQVIDALDAALGPHFFPPRADGKNPRGCPACEGGRLGLKLSRTGAFIGCSNYPDCTYTRPLAVPTEGEEDEALTFPRQLGHDPETGLPVTLRKGPFGVYIQLGGDENGEKPRRVSLPKGYAPAEITLETALALLALPREVGQHPESGKPILAGIGRYGPYLKHGTAYKSLTEDDDVLSIGMNRAVELLATAKERPGAEPLRDLGTHPDDGKPVGVFKGRFGPYVKHNKTMASLPGGVETETVTLDRALELLAAKEAKGGTGKAAGKKGGSKKAAAAEAEQAKPAAKTAKPAKAKDTKETKPAAKSTAKSGKNGSGGKAAAAKTEAKTGSKKTAPKKTAASAKSPAKRAGSTAGRGDD